LGGGGLAGGRFGDDGVVENHIIFRKAQREAATWSGGTEVVAATVQPVDGVQAKIVEVGGRSGDVVEDSALGGVPKRVAPENVAAGRVAEQVEGRNSIRRLRGMNGA
jgi:hypothetical protein